MMMLMMMLMNVRAALSTGSRWRAACRVDTWAAARAFRVTSIALIVLALAGSRIAGAPSELEPLSFLLGEWDAPAPVPGGPSGRTVFSRTLQGQAMMRTNYSETPASGGQPASRHDDLMVIYVAAPASLRADYYDGEGHVIRYRVTAPAANTALFVSDAVPNDPRYRLTYTLRPDGELQGEFAIAPPGQPDAFKSYLSWQARKLRAFGN
jgi:hypothetical protein